jgi:hypothetical protein
MHAWHIKTMQAKILHARSLNRHDVLFWFGLSSDQPTAWRTLYTQSMSSTLVALRVWSEAIYLLQFACSYQWRGKLWISAGCRGAAADCSVSSSKTQRKTELVHADTVAWVAETGDKGNRVRGHGVGPGYSHGRNISRWPLPLQRNKYRHTVENLEVKESQTEIMMWRLTCSPHAGGQN